MTDSGVGPLSFKPIKKAGSKADKDDKLQAFIRNSGKQERGNGIFATRGGSPAGEASVESSKWSILLKTLNATEARSADQFLSVVRADIPDAALQIRSAGQAITVGAFESNDAPEAQKELKRVQALEVKGLRPYQGAMLIPPDATPPPQSAGGFDLRAVGAMLGPKDAKYTLEVAIYGRPDRETPTAEELKRFRASAEEAVKVMRKDREEAYFMHTPRQSIVTVGVYSTKDIEGEESAEVQAARAKHPHVLLNGEGVKVRGSGKDAVLQKTRVVEIPKK